MSASSLRSPRGCAAALGAAALLYAMPAHAASEDLGSYVPIILICNAIFWGILALIWVAWRFYPEWEARQIRRQEELRAQRQAYRERAEEGGQERNEAEASAPKGA